MKTLTLALALIAGITNLPAAQAAPSIPRVSVSATTMTLNGARFIPRGTNYVELNGDYHSTFDQYDPAKALDIVSRLKAQKDNTVRVFINSGSFGADNGVGGGVTRTVPFKDDYLVNVTDFIRKANDNGIYVIPVMSTIPTNCYFYSLVWPSGQCNANVPTPNVAGYNAFYMDAGFVKAKAEYVKLFAAEMVARLGSSAGILAYEIDNEANFEANQAPFANRSGTVKGLNGTTYDMSVLSQRQAAADTSFALYVSRVKTALKIGDPSGKVMVGAFTNYAVSKTGFNGFPQCSGPAPCQAATDYRSPARLSKAPAIDIHDVHAYPRGNGYSLSSDLKTLEVPTFVQPWILGEFGAFRDFYPSVTAAALAMGSTMVAACQFGADGYVFWTWDTAVGEMVRMYTQTQDGGAINGQLATIARPDPCGGVAVAKRR